MKKVSNFKAHFSKILKEDYHMTKEGIDGYWENKEQEEKYDNCKKLVTSAGVGGMVGTLGFTIADVFNGVDCIIPIAIAGGISILTAGISLVKKNPYKQEACEEIDEEYHQEKKKYNKRMKKVK